jgi:predicted phosphodiesterase
MRIQVFSDLHLEFTKKVFPHISPSTRYLFLAGDIGKLNTPNYEPFFQYCSHNWEKVFYVVGNHEFYHSYKTSDELMIAYKSFFDRKFHNVFLLDNEIHTLDDNYEVYGTTLWTPPYFSETTEMQRFGLNDFYSIQGWTTDKLRETSQYQRRKLLDYLETPTSMKRIVLTHFPLTQVGVSDPKYATQHPALREYFAWELADSLPKKESIAAIISGHTHYSYDQNRNGVRLISNQLGYLREETGFEPDGVFDLSV